MQEIMTSSVERPQSTYIHTNIISDYSNKSKLKLDFENVRAIVGSDILLQYTISLKSQLLTPLRISLSENVELKS